GARRVSLLGRQLDLTPPVTSEVVERLVEQGLVTRAPDPQDRRSSILELSDVGRRRAISCRTTIHENVQAVLDQIPPEDREHLIRALPELPRAIERASELPHDVPDRSDLELDPVGVSPGISRSRDLASGGQRPLESPQPVRMRAASSNSNRSAARRISS
ncbi:transcriptional regulator, MarR family, partial [mine drainage metagenome]